MKTYGRISGECWTEAYQKAEEIRVLRCYGRAEQPVRVKLSTVFHAVDRMKIKDTVFKLVFSTAFVWTNQNILGAVIGDKYSNLPAYWKGFIWGMGAAITIIQIGLLLTNSIQEAFKKIKLYPQKILDESLSKAIPSKKQEVTVSTGRDFDQAPDSIIRNFEYQPNKIKSDLNTHNNDHHSIELKTLRVINEMRKITNSSRTRITMYALENTGQSKEDSDRLLDQEKRFFIDAYRRKCMNPAIACKKHLSQIVGDNFTSTVSLEWYSNPQHLGDIDSIADDLSNYLTFL